MPPLTGDPKQYSPESLKDGMTGKCNCGSIEVTISEKDLFSKPRGHLCSCANCRKTSGSFVASNLLIANSDVKIVDHNGTLKSYEDRESGSGNSVFRFFCGNCGNPIKSEVAALGDKVILKMGIFPRIPKPEAWGFGLHRHPWEATHEGVPVYETKWAGPEKKQMNV